MDYEFSIKVMIIDSLQLLFLLVLLSKGQGDACSNCSLPQRQLHVRTSQMNKADGLRVTLQVTQTHE